MEEADSFLSPLHSPLWLFSRAGAAGASGSAGPGAPLVGQTAALDGAVSPADTDVKALGPRVTGSGDGVLGRNLGYMRSWGWALTG